MVRAWVVALLVVGLVAASMAGEYDGAEAYPVEAERRGDSGWSSGGGGGYGGGGGGGGGASGFSAGFSGFGGWRPRFRYLNFRIPVPILPRISIGLKAGVANKGWGWQG